MDFLQHTRNIMERKEEQRSSIRKRNLVVLVNRFLLQNGYVNSAEALRNETSVKIDQFTVCDNVELEVVLQEYETFQYIKFRHYPSIVKSASFDEKRGANVCMMKKPIAKTRPIAKVSGVPTCTSPDKDVLSPKETLPKLNGCQDSFEPEKEKNSFFPLEKKCLSIEGASFGLLNTEKGTQQDNKTNISTKCVKMVGGSNKGMQYQPSFPFPSFNQDLNQLTDIITKDIYVDNPCVPWDSIVGLEDAKRIIKEAIIYPVQHPSLFCGLLAPWKGLLLYGPPGNGKTLLAKALATECKTTFFNISASTVVSKWRGDSEKLIRVLFEMARQNAPSTIFFDEVDAIMCSRETGGNSEHEASRRMKTELLVQMDGLANSEELVFVLAASNMPWDLDPALLRRLEKRVAVPLPEMKSREVMFQKFLVKRSDDSSTDCNMQLPVGDIDYRHLAEITSDYSGADIKLVCREAAMRSLRKVLESMDSNTDTSTITRLMSPLITSSVEAAIESTKPSARHLTEKYLRWQNEFGSI